MADFTNRNADETKQFILTFDENGGSPEYTKIEDANGVDRTAEVVELLGINDKEDADSTILKEGDVEDSLNSTSTTKPLSANQGKQLNDDKASLSALGGAAFEDYEEGTWTPEIAFGGSSSGITYSVNSGIYKKISDIVYVQFSIRLSSKGTSTGPARVVGFPFTVSGVGFSSDAHTIMSSQYLGLNITAGEYLFGSLVNSGTEMVLRTALPSNLDNDDFTNDTRFTMSGTYITE